MCSIGEFQKRLKDINLNVVARDAVQASKTLLLYEQKQQMYNHLRKDGSEIGPAYDPDYRKIKMTKYGQDGRVTLYKDGPFYLRFYVEVKAATFVIDSKDWKSKLLKGRYGEKIFGVGGKYKVEWIKGAGGAKGQSLMKAYMYVIKKSLQLT